MNTSPTPPPNTGDTDIDKLIKRIMVDCIDTDGVTEQNLLHFTNYGLDFKELKAAIEQKLNEARLEELRLACEYWEKNPNKPATYMIDRAEALQATKEE